METHLWRRQIGHWCAPLHGQEKGLAATQVVPSLLPTAVDDEAAETVGFHVEHDKDPPWAEQLLKSRGSLVQRA